MLCSSLLTIYLHSKHNSRIVIMKVNICLYGDKLGCGLQVGGTFWLTRLARDREATVRVAAVSLLAHLAGPTAHPTRRMLLQGWPEAGTAVLKVGFISPVHSPVQTNVERLHQAGFACPSDMPFGQAVRCTDHLMQASRATFSITVTTTMQRQGACCSNKACQ